MFQRGRRAGLAVEAFADLRAVPGRASFLLGLDQVHRRGLRSADLRRATEGALRAEAGADAPLADEGGLDEFLEGRNADRTSVRELLRPLRQQVGVPGALKFF